MNQQQSSLGMPQTGAKVSAGVGLGMNQQQMSPDQMQWGMQEMMQNMQYMMNTMQQGMTSEPIQQPTPQMQQMEQQIGKGTSSSGQWFSAAEQPITRFKMVPCKYWPGSCTRGASCAFLHNPALAKQEAAKAKLVFPQDNFIDFETGKKKEKPGSDP